MEIDKKIIRKLIEVLEDLKKSLKEIDFNSSENSSVGEETITSGTIIKSPIVGTAYLAPEPGGKKFIEVGKKINDGTFYLNPWFDYIALGAHEFINSFAKYLSLPYWAFVHFFLIEIGILATSSFILFAIQDTLRQSEL